MVVCDTVGYTTYTAFQFVCICNTCHSYDFFFVERFLVGQSTLCITVVMLQPVSTCSECMQTVFNNCQQVSTAIPQSSSEKESSTAAGSGKKAAGSAAKGKGW